jgi:PKD repeat protein
MKDINKKTLWKLFSIVFLLLPLGSSSCEDFFGGKCIDAPIISSIETNPSTNFYFYPNELTVFKAQLAIGSGTPDSYFWDFGDGITSTLKEPGHSYESPGKYCVSVWVENDGGSDEATTLIEVDEEIGTIYFWTNTDIYGQITVLLLSQTSVITQWHTAFPGCSSNEGNARFDKVEWGTYSFSAYGYFGGYWSGYVSLSDNCEAILLY